MLIEPCCENCRLRLAYAPCTAWEYGGWCSRWVWENDPLTYYSTTAIGMGDCGYLWDMAFCSPDEIKETEKLVAEWMNNIRQQEKMTP